MSIHSIESKYGLLEFQNPENPSATVIIFSAHTYTSRDQIEYWKDAFKSITTARIIAVHGPRMPLTYNGGNVQHSWYDYLTNYCEEPGHLDPSGLYSMNADREDLINLQDLAQAREDMIKLIVRESDFGPVFLVGSSQGGYMALDVGLNAPEGLVRGIFSGRGSLGSYSPIKSNKAEVVFYHGDSDEIIGLGLVKQSVRRLKKQGIKAQLNVECGLTHNGDPTGEISFLKQTLQRWLNQVGR